MGLWRVSLCGGYGAAGGGASWLDAGYERDADSVGDLDVGGVCERAAERVYQHDEADERELGDECPCRRLESRQAAHGDAEHEAGQEHQAERGPRDDAGHDGQVSVTRDDRTRHFGDHDGGQGEQGCDECESSRLPHPAAGVDVVASAVEEPGEDEVDQAVACCDEKGRRASRRTGC